MASNSTGKWVTRAASTGGGRTYRGQMPINWYASLVIIVIVGLLLVGFSRYQRTHPSSQSSGPPTTSQTWYNALGIDICGTVQPNLPASKNTSATGLAANGSGLIVIAPKNSSEAGGNATLGRFVSKYPGLELTNSTLRYPGQKLMSNGETCPKGTPDAGKQGYVIVDTWPNFTSSTSTEVSGDPTQYRFADNQMLTLAFVPATSKVKKPQASAITALINAANGTTTTTTAPPTTPTTAPAASTTTTAPPSSTTTTAPPSTTAAKGAAATTTTTAKHPSGPTK